MDPTAILDLIFKGGGWGVSIILGILYRQSMNARLEDAKVILPVLSEVKKVNEAVQETLDSRTGFFERSMVVSEQQHRENSGTLAALRSEIGELRRDLDERRRGRS